MSEVTREYLIEQIKQQRELQAEIAKKKEAFAHRQIELTEYSNMLKECIADKAQQEIKSLDYQRALISKKSLEDEEKLKNSFEAKLHQVLSQKCELERRLEAESEFIAQNLRSRMHKLQENTLLLRSEMTKKSKEISESLVHMTNDEALHKKITGYQDQAMHVASKIAEAHREIEGLQMKADRLRNILQRLVEDINEKRAEENLEFIPQVHVKNRRASCIESKRWKNQ